MRDIITKKEQEKLAKGAGIIAFLGLLTMEYQLMLGALAIAGVLWITR